MPRPPGRPNKKKQAFREALRKYAEDKGVDPHFWMVDLLTRKGVKLELKFQAAKELAQYLEPKLRAVEVSGDEEKPLSIRLDEIARLSDAEILSYLEAYYAHGHRERRP